MKNSVPFGIKHRVGEEIFHPRNSNGVILRLDLNGQAKVRIEAANTQPCPIGHGVVIELVDNFFVGELDPSRLSCNGEEEERIQVKVDVSDSPRVLATSQLSMMKATYSKSRGGTLAVEITALIVTKSDYRGGRIGIS